MKTKKILSVLLALAMLCALLPAAAAADDMTEVDTWEELKAALAEGKRCCLVEDINAPADAEGLEVPEGVTASLDLNGFTLDGGTPGDEDCVVLVHGSFTLTDNSAKGTGRITETRDAVDVIGGDFILAGGTLDGCGNIGVAVTEGGNFTMTGGTVRKCGQIGVYVTGEGSTATVNGGEITGSVGYYEDDWFYHGTGLQADYGATAEIAGGVISGNVFGAKAIEATLIFSGGEVRDNREVPIGESDTYGGSGLYAYHGKIQMTGGAVSGNVFVGLYIDEGSEVEVSGGTNSGNSFAGLLALAGSETKISGGKISGDGIFAVQMRGGSVTVTGGEITGGTEAGIHLEDGALHLDGGKVSGSPKDAVWVTDGEVTMTDGLLSDNAWNGVHLDAGSFTMSGGTIRDNGYCGVALYGQNGEVPSCAMTGGEISNCYIGIMQDVGEIFLSGAPEFSGTDSLCDVGLTDAVIVLSGPLTVSTPISVALETYPAAGESRTLTSGLRGNGSIYQFTTIEGDPYHIEANENGEAVMVFGPAPNSDDDYAPTPSGGTKPEEKTNQTAEESVTYTNVPENVWYAADAAFAQEVNLFGESGEQPFDGEKEVDRGTAVYALWVLAGKPGEGEDAAVTWAADTGILKGDGSGDYALGEELTREQLCTMIYRYLQENGKGFTGAWAFRLDFSDADQISEYAYEAVSYLVMEGILKGMDGELNPGGIATKAQVAALMQRVEEFLK